MAEQGGAIALGRFPVHLSGLVMASFLALPWGCGWPPSKSPQPWEGRRLVPLSTSRIFQDEHFLGRFKEFEFPDPVQPSRLWLLENEYGQWVGWVDGVGRAFKLEAHERDGRHVATGSLPLCAQALLGLDRPPRMTLEWRAEAP